MNEPFQARKDRARVLRGDASKTSKKNPRQNERERERWREADSSRKEPRCGDDNEFGMLMQRLPWLVHGSLAVYRGGKLVMLSSDALGLSLKP